MYAFLLQSHYSNCIMFRIRDSVPSWNIKGGISSTLFLKFNSSMHLLEASLNVTPATHSCVAEYLGKIISLYLYHYMVESNWVEAIQRT